MTRKRSSRKIKKLRNNFNIVFATIIFLLMIGFAFSIDWIFGVSFIFGFLLSMYNDILEKRPLIPIFIFAGALVIRYALFVMLPPILEAGNIISLGISILLFLIIIFIGFRLRKGKWKFWRFNPKKDFNVLKKPKIKKKVRRIKKKIKKEKRIQKNKFTQRDK